MSTLNDNTTAGLPPEADARMDSYAKALDSMAFSPKEKARMAGRIAQAARTGSELGMVEGGRKAASRAQRPGRWSRPTRVAAAALVAALALGGGGAYASGSLVSLSNAVDDLFGAAPASTEVVNSVGHPIGALASSGGISISADAIIGDAHNYMVVYSIAKDDGTPFKNLEATDQGFLTCFAFDSFNTSLDVSWSGSNGSSYFYDADPSDPAIQYVETTSIHGDESIAGSVMHSKFKNLLVFDKPIDRGGSAETIEGEWNLKFDLEYEDSSVALTSDAPINLYGYDMRLDSASISPIALHFEYVVDRPVDWTTKESGRQSEEDVKLADELLDIPQIVVTLADGSTIEGKATGGGSIDSGEAGKAVCETNVFFDRIVDLDEVVSVSIGGTELSGI